MCVYIYICINNNSNNNIIVIVNTSRKKIILIVIRIGPTRAAGAARPGARAVPSEASASIRGMHFPNSFYQGNAFP